MRYFVTSMLISALWVGTAWCQESLPSKKGNPGTGKTNPQGNSPGGSASGKSAGGSGKSPANSGAPASGSGKTAPSGASDNGPASGSGKGGGKSAGNPAGNSGKAAAGGNPAESKNREALNPPAGNAARTGAANKGKAETPTLTAGQKEQVSYAIGLDLAERFKAEGEDVDFEMILRGMTDGYEGKDPAFTPEQMQTAMNAFQQYMQVKAQEQLRNFAAENVAFLDANKKKAGVKVTKSGLQYQVLKSGSGKSPKATDWIKAHYHGTLINGEMFESTVQQGGEPVEIAVEDTIPGWAEALAMMKVGDKWRLFIPPSLAYGDLGQGPVPPHATLVFELELLDIVKPPKNEGEQEAKTSQNLK